uniref:cytochrome P450 n=1 Tax=Paractinoplanes polyasparticus TaxID=2856853 RepID=UPI001C843C71|nr:cytochrome P450 [Actinoplanes polyasparticus]
MITVDKLPGPRPRPLSGNVSELTEDRQSHRVLERWADEYGLTYRFRVGRQTIVVTADPAHVEAALRRRPDDFRRGSRMSGLIEEIISDGVFTAEGDRWRRLRKAATQSLNAAYLRQYFTTITRVTERLHRQWETAAASGARIDVLNQMVRYTLDVTAGLATGHDLNSLENTGDGLHRRAPVIFPAIGRRMSAPFAYWRYLRLPRDRRLDATVSEIEAVIRERFAAARARAGSEPPSTFLEALMRPLDDEPEITDDEVCGNVLQMLLAGEDTTSSTAAWALYFLAEHPAIHAKVRAEADRVFGDRRLPGDPATVGRLEYATAVINEVLRVQPVVPALVVEPTQDLTLTGSDGRSLAVPAGQPIYLLTNYGARRDTTRFPDPDRFRPERWLEGSLPPEALPFVPFGSGPRFCPGRNLALIEAAMVTSVLARSFDFNLDRTAGEVRERFAFAVVPTNVHLRAVAREQSPHEDESPAMTSRP